MSSDKSDEFSLDGLEDLDLSENTEDELATPLEEEGFDLDLSSDAGDFSLSEEGEEVTSEAVADPNEFSLTNVDINISLSDGEEVPSEEVLPEDMIDLGEESKDEFHLSEEAADDSILEGEDDLEAFSLDDDILAQDSEEFSLDDEAADLPEELPSMDAFSLDDNLTGSPDDISDDEDLFGLSAESEVTAEEAPFDPLADYSSPQIKLEPEDLTEEVRAKLKEIDAIMEEDATRAAFQVNSEEMEEELDSSTDDNIGLSLEEDDDKFDLSSELAVEDEILDEEFAESHSELEADSLVAEDLLLSEEPSADESLVGDLNLSDLDLDEEIGEDILNLGGEQEEVAVEREAAPIPPTKKKKKKEATPTAPLSQGLAEISEAYTGEMERTQATIANLRADRDELLKRIDHLEEEKLLGQRQHLNLRAELDEKKIELTIIRKKLNEEINDLKDRLRLYEERVLILEEKNKQLHQEIDSAGQKNRIDVKRVMLRERELEQKLELLKADAETQIRNRDLKILELKRKIDAMEFDMESISQQEKKTLESRFELEDKLDKAIRTLRSAISTLEEDGNRSATLEAIKKNIEM